MATALDDFELADPSLNDFQVVPPAKKTVTLTQPQDLSDFQLAEPTEKDQFFSSNRPTDNAGTKSDLGSFLKTDTPSDIQGDFGGEKSKEDLSIKDFAFRPAEGFGDIPDISFPKLSPEHAGEITRAMDVSGVSRLLPKDVVDRVSGIGSGVLADTVNFFKSPVGMMSSGIAGLPSVAQKGITAAFLASALKESPEKYAEIRDAKTPEERDAAIASAIETAMVLGGTASHVLGHAETLPREAGAPQEQLDAAGQRNELQQLAPPETAPEPKAQGTPEILDGLQIARRKLAGTPEQFAALPPEVQQARQAEIDRIDEELLRHDRTAVSESASRTAQPQSDAVHSEESVSGRVTPILNELTKRRDRGQQKQDIGKELGNPELEEEGRQEKNAAEDEMVDRLGTNSPLLSNAAVASKLNSGTHVWEEGYGLRKKSTSAEKTTEPAQPTERQSPPATGELQSSPQPTRNAFRILRQEAADKAVQPVLEAADAARDVAPETAKAADQIAATIAEKTAASRIKEPNLVQQRRMSPEDAARFINSTKELSTEDIKKHLVGISDWLGEFSDHGTEIYNEELRRRGESIPEPTLPTGNTVEPKAKAQPYITAYHTTSSDPFDNFDPSKIGSSAGHSDPVSGFYFSTDPAHSSNIPEGSEGKFRRMEVALNLKNPLRAKNYNEVGNRFGFDGDAARKQIEALGYDGVVYSDGDEVVAFHPEQIKINKQNTEQGAVDALPRGNTVEPDVDSPLPDWMSGNAKAALDALPKPIKDRISDLAYEGKTAKEIASELGIDEDTIRSARIGLGIPSQTIGGVGGVHQLNPDFQVWRDNYVKNKVTPAVQLPNGQVTTGENHVAAYDEAKKTTPDTSGAKEGFQDSQGNFLTREQAAAKTGLPTETEPGKLHSSDLPDSQPKTRGAFKPDEVSKFLKSLGEEEPAQEPVSEAPQVRKPLSREETIAALQRELDSAREDERTHDVTRLKKRIKELSAEPKEETQEQASEEQQAAQSEQPKEIWQRTRDEVQATGDSLAKHRLAVRDAVKRGEQVPLEVLEGFSGSEWADAARKKLYGDQISDSFLGNILKGLSDDPSKQYSDPLFIQSVGKPALRAAIRILQEGIEAGKLGHDAVTDAINYLKDKIPNLNEDKANEFFDQFFETQAEAEPQPEKPSVATPDRAGVRVPSPETVETEASGRGADESGEQLTSTQHAFTEAERAARGAGEREQQGAQAFGDIWDKAKQEIDFSRNRAPDLVKEINTKPRATTALEEAILLRHKVSVMNELDGHVERALDESADPQERLSSQVQSARLLDELNEIDRATSFSGSETGRSLRFRQELAAQDYSLARMLQRKQLANEGRPLTPEETAIVAKQNARIADLEKQFGEHAQKLSEQTEKLKDAEADKRIAEISAKQTPAEKYAQGLVERIQQGLKSEADKARARIRARLGKANALVDPTVVYDAAIIGAEKLFNVGVDFAKWSKEMIADIGEEIRPHLEEIFKAAQKVNEDALEKGVPKSSDRQKVKDKAATDAEKRAAIVETIRGRKGTNEAVGAQIQKLAENFVRSGITEREALVDAVHAAVKDALPDATRRDIRDAISGYGDFKELSKDEIKAKLRDLKGQMQQVSKIEDITSEGKAKKTGVQRRIPTAEERRLLAEVNRVKKEYGIDTDDPEALKSALGAAKTRLRNRIEDLQRAIDKKEKLVPKGKKLVEDAETIDLRKQKDDLQKEYDAVFETPKKTPEEIALAAYKTRTQNRINDLNDRLKRSDFSKAPKKELKLDSEGVALKQKVAAAKLEFDRAVFRDKQKNRKFWETALDTTAKTERAFLLSNPVTLAKLTAAAGWRLGITPLEELAGAGLGKLPFVSEIAARAPREGNGLNVRAEVKSLTEGFTKGMKDAWDKLRTGETALDAAGGKRIIADHHWIDFIGNVHGALKAPVVRAEFARSFEKRARFYMDNGVDVTDPMVQERITLEAYKDAQRAIFSQDNRIVSIYNAALKMLEAPSKETGRPSALGKIGAFGLKTIFPIVKIPTNIVAEAMQYATGSITGSARLAGAFRRGVETLKPEEADLIMRQLKKGSLGAAALTLGYLAPQVFGGYYQQGMKRNDKDVPTGGARLYGQDIPKTILHAPLLEALQVGATARRVADSKLRKRDTRPQGVPAGVQAAALGLIEEVPFVRDTLELSKAFNPYERGRFFDELAKSRVVPQFSQWLAERLDQRNGQPVKRDPQDLKETLKTGVPGLRQQVPEKKKRFTIRRY